MSDELASNVRKYRRAAGWSQEELAHHAGLSVGPVRRIEQGHDGVRMETLHAIARAFDVRTSALMASGVPEPVAHGNSNGMHLRDLRIALTPAVGLGSVSAPAGDEPDVSRLRRMTTPSSTSRTATGALRPTFRLSSLPRMTRLPTTTRARSARRLWWPVLRLCNWQAGI
ncbi:helix-turn-helix domain-containing protein [Streptomyces sp. NPDC056672]|uniref:helix-turn-helix domain-containing protein n=1 Tax=Streptomyces sp. NPDC056672 TaxID=3345906 RepID=UPI0036AF93B0